MTTHVDVDDSTSRRASLAHRRAVDAVEDMHEIVEAAQRTLDEAAAILRDLTTKAPGNVLSVEVTAVNTARLAEVATTLDAVREDLAVALDAP